MKLWQKSLCAISIGFSLLAMEKEPKVSSLPKDIMVKICEYLEGNDPALNYLVRLYGLTPEIAQKIVESFMEQEHIFPADTQRLEMIVAHFKTAKSHTELSRKLQEALTEYTKERPFETTLRKRDYAPFAALLHNLLQVKPAYWSQVLESPIVGPVTHDMLRTRLQLSTEDILTLKNNLQKLYNQLDACRIVLKKHIAGHDKKDFYTLGTVFSPVPLLFIVMIATMIWAGGDARYEPYVTSSFATFFSTSIVCLAGLIIYAVKSDSTVDRLPQSAQLLEKHCRFLSHAISVLTNLIKEKQNTLA